MTTRQITSALGQRTDFGQNQSTELSQLLQLSDLVKFAKARPAVELHAEGLKRVRTFVEETGKVPEPRESDSHTVTASGSQIVTPSVSQTADELTRNEEE
jgi:hypothetical protein